MKLRTIAFMVTLGALIVSGCPSSPTKRSTARPLKAGGVFPRIAMPAPAQPEDMMYLGLRNRDTFSLMDVQADVVFVEILNTHCYSCKKQVRSNNALFNLINGDPDTKGRIKIFGIAVGNSLDEVRNFRQAYHIPYPIVPDPDFQLHEAVGFCKTPYSIYIRKNQRTGSGRIMKTHLGANLDYNAVFDRLLDILSADIPPDLSAKATDNVASEAKELPFSRREIEMKVRSAFISLGATFSHIKEIPSSPGAGYVYTGEMDTDGKVQMLFAVAESRTVPCDVCYDAHFIYIFDTTGKVVLLESIQLSKDGNLPWDENDMSQIRSGILGKYIYNHFPFDAEVDAISSATITSQVIYDSLSDAQKIYGILKGKGLLK